jgi:alpha-tubulin suppressor-like RCC1 family protein
MRRWNDAPRSRATVLAAGLLVVMTVSAVTASLAGNVVAANPQTSPHHVVAVGGSHACVIYGTTSALRCWGDNTFGQLGVANVSTFTPNPKVPTGVSGVVDVATGTSHTCAALSTGAVKCWGTNSQGQLGRGNTFSDSSHPTPTAVQGLTGVKAVQVAAGSEHSCALLSNGTVRCWGADNAGQLGNNSLVAVGHAVAVAGITGAVAITVGTAHSCALLGDRTVTCWGRGIEGQLGRNAFTSSKVPVAVVGLSGVIAIAAGRNHTCAVLLTGAARCWGENKFGELGNNSKVNAKLPVVVAGITAATSLGAGFDHTCARLANGTARCWGDNADGEMGDNTHTVRATPAVVAGLSGVTAIAGGDGVTCAVLANGTARCWGYNAVGALGNGALITNRTSVLVAGLPSGVTRIDAGGSHTCAVVKGAVKCWGANASGQLGNGSTQYSATPVQVTGLLSGVTDVGTGSDTFNREFSCALLAVGKVKCWGDNSRLQLGVTAPKASNVPVFVTGIDGLTNATRATAITVGNEHACALMASHSVLCWGDNGSEELGGGVSLGASRSATPIRTSIVASQVAAGGDFTCAIVQNDAVECWGNNDFGQVDAGSMPLSTPTPTAIPEFDGTSLALSAIQLSVGFGHACAVASSGDVSCWGDSIDGQGGFSSTGGGIAEVSASWFHTCVRYVGSVGLQGGLRCIGQNFDGQLGRGDTVDSPDTLVDVLVVTTTSPVAQFGATEVAASVSHTCAVVAGRAKCWGANDVGQLGDGKTNSAVPQVVKSVVSARQPSATTTVPWAAAAPKVITGLHKAILTWTAPANGGKPITDYVVQYSKAGGAWTTFADGVHATTGATVTGLAHASFSFRVLAKNALGVGAPSTKSAAVLVP